MNDLQIRRSFHKKILRYHHAAEETLVLDELGLMHGACRADIAVINGQLVGFEIKSEKDSLVRLKKQVAAYDAVFDSVSIIVSGKHGENIAMHVPKHWGIILSKRGKRGAINFNTRRKSKPNPCVDTMAVVRLLWRNEAVEILQGIGAPSRLLKSPRLKLYRFLSENMSSEKLKQIVRIYLRKRSNWKYRKQLSRYDGLFQPTAM